MEAPMKLNPQMQPLLETILYALREAVNSLELSRQEHQKLTTEFKEFQRRTELQYQDILSLLVKAFPHLPPSPYILVTEFPIALDSHDHIFPLGTRTDNTRYPRFVKRCADLYGRKISAMDLGCAGGGLVLDFLLEGHQAIGLEGSNFSLINQQAQWRWLKDRLFTCDITKPFQVTDSSLPGAAKFDIVSAWEVLEHIPEDRLPQLFANIRQHLKADGLFIASVATFECSDPSTGAVWHVTIKPEEWWAEKLKASGLVLVDGIFDTYDFPRGSGNGSMDWNHETQPELGFHVVAKPATSM